MGKQGKNWLQKIILSFIFQTNYMKTVQSIFFSFFVATFLSCSSSENKPASPADSTNHTKDSLHETSANKVSADTSTNKALTLEAQFVNFSLGDVSHYTFKDKTGKLWDFAGYKDEAYKFGIELPAKQANETNQGWGSNKTLQGKWFELTYEYVEQPEYQDGPMVKVPVIVKATAK
jgi:hypothetical protein